MQDASLKYGPDTPIHVIYPKYSVHLQELYMEGRYRQNYTTIL